MSNEKTTIIKNSGDGRLTIPRGFRKVLNWDSIKELEISIDKGTIIIKPLREGCVLCGNNSGIDFGNYCLCTSCFDKIAKAIKDKESE